MYFYTLNKYCMHKKYDFNLILCTKLNKYYILFKFTLTNLQKTYNLFTNKKRATVP